MDSLSLSRPSKRARNTSFVEGPSFQYPRLPSMEEQPHPFVTNQLTTSPGGLDSVKGRPEDRGNRKLSCKECRSVIAFSPASHAKNEAAEACAPTVLILPLDSIFVIVADVWQTGALTSGRGSRFILANTEQLHDKIFQLSDRVRQLEDALETLQSKSSGRTHPLLSPELLKIKTSQELYGINNPLNPMSMADGRENDLQQSVVALTLNSQPPYAEGSRPNTDFTSEETSPPEVPSTILQLSATFPFPWAVDISIRQRIRDALPPREEALRICQEARNNALWQFNIDPSETFLPNLLHYCYTTSIESLSPRRLALLLMHLSIGSLVDLTRPLGYLHGEAYHHLARAAVCEIPLMEEPDFDVLHALFFMIWYHLIFSDNKKCIGYAWNLMGFVAKLAQGLGLHRDSPRLKGIPEEHEKQVAIFWELLNMDCRMSLSLSRPSSIRLAHVDIKPPTYIGPGLYVPREEIAYHEWKNAFFIQCLTPMLEVMVAVEAPNYLYILDLDTQVRDFGVPSLLDEHQSHDVSPRFLVMQRGLVAMSREIALLQHHRRYLTQALSGPESFDLNHKYAPSVLATYLSASNLISAVETLWQQEPQLTARFLHFWFNSFSAVVTLSLFVSRAPSTSLASLAVKDMERGCRLFRSAATVLPFSGKALPVMLKITEKARRTLLHSHGPEPYVFTSSTGTGTSAAQSIELPTSFNNVHAVLLQCAAKVVTRSPIQASSSTTGPEPLSQPESVFTPSTTNKEAETWLPDIYHFSSIGINMEERYHFASSKPMPFIPLSPRVGEHEQYNLDHGAMTAGLVDEASYMAWF